MICPSSYVTGMFGNLFGAKDRNEEENERQREKMIKDEIQRQVAEQRAEAERKAKEEAELALEEKEEKERLYREEYACYSSDEELDPHGRDAKSLEFYKYVNFPNGNHHPMHSPFHLQHKKEEGNNDNAVELALGTSASQASLRSVYSDETKDSSVYNADVGGDNIYSEQATTQHAADLQQINVLDVRE